MEGLECARAAQVLGHVDKLVAAVVACRGVALRPRQQIALSTLEVKTHALLTQHRCVTHVSAAEGGS
eukprot:4650247-Pleurochrysis_carterae.AAC.2